jgi:hypothetical protein
LFAKDLAYVIDNMPEGTEIQRSQKTVMIGIQTQYTRSSANLDKINKLKDYLTVLDQRRGTNWHALFPWLDQDFSV